LGGHEGRKARDQEGDHDDDQASDRQFVFLEISPESLLWRFHKLGQNFRETFSKPFGFLTSNSKYQISNPK
jgi:hypothetical protein